MGDPIKIKSCTDLRAQSILHARTGSLGILGRTAPLAPRTWGGGKQKKNPPERNILCGKDHFPKLVNFVQPHFLISAGVGSGFRIFLPSNGKCRLRLGGTGHIPPALRQNVFFLQVSVPPISPKLLAGIDLARVSISGPSLRPTIAHWRGNGLGWERTGVFWRP